jgi:hypothetical protein
MAETWDTLAEERAGRLRQQRRIAALEDSPFEAKDEAAGFVSQCGDSDRGSC